MGRIEDNQMVNVQLINKKNNRPGSKNADAKKQAWPIMLKPKLYCFNMVA